MARDPHILVAGAGAMGSLFGGLLAERGLLVTLYARRPEHVSAIRRDGLLIRGEGGDRSIRVAAETEVAAIPAADVIFFHCKTSATAEVARQVKPLLNEAGLAVSFQNGLGNEDVIASILGSEKVIGGLTALGATLEGPGIVRSYATLRTLVGELAGGVSDRSRSLATLMTTHGVPTEASPDIVGEKWRKLLLNVALSATSGLTGLTIGEIAAIPSLARLAKRAMDEAAAVAQATGVNLPLNDRYATFEAVVNSGAARNKTSMRRDVEARRPSEVDSIYASVIGLGAAHGVGTPNLETLAALIEGVESTYGSG